MCVAALGIIGSVISAIGSMASASAQASQMEYNAKVEEINARTARQQGLYEADKKEDEYQQIQGQQRVAAVASGLDPGQGSAAFIIDRDTGKNAYLDQMTLIWNRETEAVGHENKAQDLRAQAKATRMGGMISGASSIIGGLKGGGGFGGSLSIG